MTRVEKRLRHRVDALVDQRDELQGRVVALEAQVNALRHAWQPCVLCGALSKQPYCHLHRGIA